MTVYNRANMEQWEAGLKQINAPEQFKIMLEHGDSLLEFDAIEGYKPSLYLKMMKVFVAAFDRLTKTTHVAVKFIEGLKKRELLQLVIESAEEGDFCAQLHTMCKLGLVERNEVFRRGYIDESGIIKLQAWVQKELSSENIYQVTALALQLIRSALRETEIDRISY